MVQFSMKMRKPRVADVDVRVGDWTLDNTHPLIDGGYFSDEPTHFSESVPIGDDPLMLQALHLEDGRSSL